MCKFLASLTFLLIFSITLFGANVVPIVDLPLKPTKQLMNNLNKNAELFAERVLSYYTTALCYEAQLHSMGIRPTRELIAPTADQLSKPNQKVLQTQWQQAAMLHKQVSSVPVTKGHPKVDSLRSNERKLQEELSLLRAKNAELEIELIHLEHYPELYKNAVQSIDRFKERVNRHTVPTLGISTGVTTLVFNDEMISSNAGVNVGLIFNPTQLLGIGNFFDIWFDYSTPDIKTQHSNYYDYGYYNETIVHNTNVLALGANLVLPLSRIFEIEKYLWNLKGGVGYYWIDDKMPNVNLENNLWKGVLLKAETEFVNLATRFPFGVYLSGTLNYTNADLILNHPNYYGNIEFGNRWFVSLNAGLRFYLTGSYK